MPDEPTLTASEVKVLTETATRVAYALGRKDAGEEIAAEFEYLGVILGSYVAKKVRSMSSQPSQAASDATSGVPGHPEVGSESQVVSNRIPAFCGRCEASTHWESVERAQAWFDGHMASHAAQDTKKAARSPQDPCGHPTCPCASKEAK